MANGQTDPTLVQKIAKAMESLQPMFQQYNQGLQGAQSRSGAGTPGFSGTIPDVTNPQNAPPMTPMQQAAPHTRGVLPQQQPTDTSRLYPRQGPSVAGLNVGYPTKRGAQVATASAITQDLMNFANMVEQRNYQKSESEAEYYLREIDAAIHDGDQKRLQVLVENPKVKQVLKKVKGIEVLPEEGPSSQKSPEESALEKVAKSGGGRIKQMIQRVAGQQGGPQQPPKLPVTPSASQQAAASQAQSAEMVTRQQQQDLSQSVEARRAAATGSTLSPQQQQQAALFEAGLAGLNPKEQALLRAQANTQQARLDTQIQLGRMHYDAVIKAKMLDAKTDLQKAAIMASPQWKRYEMMEKMHGDAMKLNMEKGPLAALGVMQKTYTQMLKDATSTINSANAKTEDVEAARRELPYLNQQLSAVNQQLQQASTSQLLGGIGIGVGEETGQQQQQSAPAEVTPSPQVSDDTN